jgi:hypothetical protein
LYQASTSFFICLLQQLLPECNIAGVMHGCLCYQFRQPFAFFELLSLGWVLQIARVLMQVGVT